jgi:hypothetical protein
MRSHVLARIALAASLAAAPLTLATAVAATASEVTPGMQVVDPTGGAVGVITGVKGGNVVLKTDKHEVQLPVSSFTAHEGKLLFGMTAAELNAETEAALAAAEAAIAVGAQVLGSEGAAVGQIEALDEEYVTIKLSAGSSVRIPRSGIRGGPNGAVIGLSASELAELAGQAAAPTADQPAEQQ